MTEPIRCRTAADLTRHLAATRRERGISQRELAGILHVVQSALSHWESGKHVVGISNTVEWAAALGYDLALIPRPPYLVDVPLPDKDVEL